MKTSELRRRLNRDRPLCDISLRIPEDVVEDLDRIAPHLGFSDHQPLIRAYIGQGLRADLERFEGTMKISEFVESLRKQGVDDAVISSAMAEAELYAAKSAPGLKAIRMGPIPPGNLKHTDPAKRSGRKTGEALATNLS